MTDDLHKRRQHAKERMVFWARTLAKLDEQIKRERKDAAVSSNRIQPIRHRPVATPDPGEVIGTGGG